MAFDQLHARAASGRADAGAISIRCPSCGDHGNFERVIGDVLDVSASGGDHSITFGHRMCPQFTCRAIVFFARVNDELITFPPEVLEIDTVDLPPVVAESLKEAVACHAAAAYRAAAIMLRRSVEAMCDERGAKGSTLKERLKVLRSKVILPEELFDAVEELRLLGNDGAHITARQFDDVGREEVEAALPLVREVLKAVYQYKALLRGLQARKKPAT